MPTRAPDRKDDPEAVHESDQVTEQPEKGEQRHAEQGRPFRHRHHDGGADHERCRHDADGRPIDRIVEAIAEAVEALEVEIDPHSAVPRVFDQSREVARHRRDQAKEVAERHLGAPRRFRRLIALTHGAIEKRLNAFDQTELWVVLAAKPLEADERLEQEREVDRQHDRMLAQDRRILRSNIPILRSFNCKST